MSDPGRLPTLGAQEHASEIDVRALLDDPPLRRFHLRLGLLLGAVLFFDGYDLFNAAYVAPYVRLAWGLGPVQLGILLSAGILGLALGSMGVGFAADRLGRQPMLILALWLISAASAVLATVVNAFAPFIAARIALGLGLGMVTPLALTYLNEWAPRSTANRFATTVFLFGFASGGIAAGLVGIWVVPRFGWQSLYALGALSVLAALGCQAWLPESLRYLVAKQRWAEVRAMLGRLDPAGSAAVERSADDWVEAIVSRAAGAFPRPEQSASLRTTLVIWAVGALSLFCVHGLVNWLPTVMIGQGASVTAAFSLGVAVMVMQVIGGLACAQLADRWRRRREVMALAYLGGAAAMLGFAYARGFWAMAALLCCGAFFVFGGQAILNNFTAQSYAVAVRATRVGVAVGIARVGGVLGPFVIGVLQRVRPGFGLVFYVMAAVLVAAAGLILLARNEGGDVEPAQP